ncbi:transcriptional activator RfaH, partial [Amylibacter sp.]|nr:transcriptional activator RfaH [Amylibacter sp.]
VSFNKTPTVVPQDLINQLMQRCDIKTKLQPAKFLKNGDNVTLINGPFVNFVAKVENIASDQRAWLLIEIMGSQTRVSVKENQLRIVNK